MSKESKLVELRRKTDRDLMILVQRELDRGLALANVAATKESPLYAQAKEVYEIVNAWLPLIIGLEPDDRRELEFGLRELWVALDRLSSQRMQRHFAGAAAGL